MKDDWLSIKYGQGLKVAIVKNTLRITYYRRMEAGHWEMGKSRIFAPRELLEMLK